MEFVQIGFTKKSHGIQGEIKVAIDEQFEDLFLESERVYLEVKGAKMPFFLEQIRGGGELIVKFEDVQNREQAIAIQSRPIFMPAKEIPAIVMQDVQELAYAYLTGFEMSDVEAGVIGPIDEMIEMPQQEMAVVLYKKKELLVPMNPSLIVSIDRGQKKILMNLPEGMLDLV